MDSRIIYWCETHEAVGHQPDDQTHCWMDFVGDCSMVQMSLRPPGVSEGILDRLA